MNIKHLQYTPYLIIAELSTIKPGGLPNVPANDNSLQQILGLVFGIAGALALLMITISGLRYITSAGDPQKAAKARSGIIVALVGLAIAIAGESIVVFAINRVN